MPTSIARASASSGSLRLSDSSARSNRFSSAASSSGRNTSTRARDKSAAFSSNDGFSVVAPTSVTVPSSITGRNESCCARLKRWISSMKSSVPLPVWRRARAASNAFFRSATPEKTAESCSKCRSVSSASSRATVVLPVPGGPQRIREPSVPERSMRVSAPSGPRRWSWPTTSDERARAQAVRQRSWRRLLKACGGEEVGHRRYQGPITVGRICPFRLMENRQTRAVRLARSCIRAVEFDRLAVDIENNVARRQADLPRGRVLRDVGHHDAGVAAFHAEIFSDGGRHVDDRRTGKGRAPADLAFVARHGFRRGHEMNLHAARAARCEALREPRRCRHLSW